MNLDCFSKERDFDLTSIEKLSDRDFYLGNRKSHGDLWESDLAYFDLYSWKVDDLFELEIGF
jgi:hypothetical protein